MFNLKKIRRKLVFIFIIISCLLIAFLLKKPTYLLSQKSCAFCDLKILNNQKFYEDDLVLALYTHKPVMPCHFLVIPKRHILRFEDLSKEEMVRVAEVIKKVNSETLKAFKTASYLVHQKNGVEVGQSVPHVHFHYIARHKGDASTLKFMANMLIAQLKGPISDKKMTHMVEKMKLAIQTPN